MYKGENRFSAAIPLQDANKVGVSLNILVASSEMVLTRIQKPIPLGGLEFIVLVSMPVIAVLLTD